MLRSVQALAPVDRFRNPPRYTAPRPLPYAEGSAAPQTVKQMLQDPSIRRPRIETPLTTLDSAGDV